uniref:Uncharacterized protein n=1 Tax=Timema poppense TaxID=170557 RepID=A0A7R9DUI5_TIMPO|nr:unnamed protein product [Timema poppensis]
MFVQGGDASVEEHQRTLQQLAYQYVSRSLFKADRLSLALHLEWQVLTGQAMADVKVDTSKISQNVPGWLSEERAFDVFVLKSALPELYSQLNLDDETTWSNFSTAGDCEEHFPVQLSHKLTPFQRVLIVQALRPDRLHSSLLHFAAHILGLSALFALDTFAVVCYPPSTVSDILLPLCVSDILLPFCVSDILLPLCV